MDEMVLSKAAAAPPQVFRPWRRFFARMLDWWLYGRLWFVFQLLVLNRNAANWSNTLWGLIVDTVVQMVLAILAFAGAPKDIHAWEAIYPSWLKEVSAFEDFSFTWGQTNIACTVKCSGYGYTKSLELLWPQDGVPRHYELQFVLTRL